MRRIIESNIKRFRELLENETDPTKLMMERRLLAEEEMKLKQLDAEQDEQKSF